MMQFAGQQGLPEPVSQVRRTLREMVMSSITVEGVRECVDALRQIGIGKMAAEAHQVSALGQYIEQAIGRAPRAGTVGARLGLARPKTLGDCAEALATVIEAQDAGLIDDRAAASLRENYLGLMHVLRAMQGQDAGQQQPIQIIVRGAVPEPKPEHQGGAVQ